MSATRTVTFIAATLAGALLHACATVPAPNDSIQAAETAIKHAEEARVADYASPELSSARDKLTAARAAMQAEDMVLARRLADQAKLDADLAAAKMQAKKAESSNVEMQKSIDAMQSEMQRNNGAKR